MERTSKEAFSAITNVHGWWSEEIEGGAQELGDEFTYRYEDVRRCKIRVTEVIPDRKVSWLVVDNYFDFTEDKTEWKGTTISFEIAEKDDKTEIHFTHLGLVAEYERFDVCSEGWGFYINGSLRSLIATGEGQPNGRGRPRTSAEEELRTGRGPSTWSRRSSPPSLLARRCADSCLADSCSARILFSDMLRVLSDRTHDWMSASRRPRSVQEGPASARVARCANQQNRRSARCGTATVIRSRRPG